MIAMSTDLGFLKIQIVIFTFLYNFKIQNMVVLTTVHKYVVHRINQFSVFAFFPRNKTKILVYAREGRVKRNLKNSKK